MKTMSTTKFNNTQSLYAINGSVIKDFISKKDYLPDETTERRLAHENQYGYITALFDGFVSDGNKRLEIVLPEQGDLSISQNKGFTLFFWFLAKKQSKGVHRFILKRGNSLEELTPSVGILPNGLNLFVKIQSSKHRMETLFSSKTIDPNRLYCVSVTFEIDYNNDLTDISLYLDGLMDSQITVPGEPMHNQGNLYIGKVDNMSYGFSGFVADTILIPRVLQPEEVNLIYKGCIYNLNTYKATRSYDIIGRKLERDVLIERYSKHSGIATHLLENLDMTNEELKEVVRKYENVEETQQVAEIDNNLVEQEQDAKTLEKFEQFLGRDDSDLTINLKKIFINSRFIYTIMFLSAEDLNFEVERIMGIFDVLKETLHITIEQKDVIELGKLFKIYTKDGNKIKIDEFFKKIKFYMSHIYPDLKGGSHIGDSRVEDFNNVELHENLLLNSQNFKNYIDDDFERDLAKSSFTIRSLYSRNKSAGRPMTGKITTQNNNEDDMVQQYGFDDIPERRNEMEEDEEGENIITRNNDDYDRKQSKHLSNHSGDKIKEEVDEELENKSEKAKSHISEKSKVSKKTKNDNENVIGGDKDIDAANEEIFIKEGDDFKPVIIENDENKDEEPKKDQFMDTANEDVISNLDNKVILQSGSQGFNDENMIAISNLNELEKQDEVKEEKGDLEPKYPDNWNQGAFEIVINHCYDCHKHKTTTRHFEYTFVQKFNNLSDSLKIAFPNINIIGNYDKMEYLSCFDVYIRGVGTKLDEQGRYFIYRKLNTKKFPKDHEITDRLTALSMLYGSSLNMEAAQSQYVKAYSTTIPKQNPEAHEHPCSLSEEAEKEKQAYDNSKVVPPKDDPDRTKFLCTNWGCKQTYVLSGNHSKVCNFHPGVWQFGSYHAYWPEAWTCCERGWGEQGCTKGYHRGVRVEKTVFLCLNMGENGLKKRPDSACGQYFVGSQPEGCKYHPGSINRQGRYTCCDSDGEKKEGCTETKHQTCLWPDQKAKLYFYPKFITNPGLKYSNDKKISVADLIINCDHFKPVVAYDNPLTKMQILKMKRERELEEPRYCFRWACEKVYKENENNTLSCFCHPGKWDHGSTGQTLKTYIEETQQDPKTLKKKTILWAPHWTCCLGAWDAKGCRRMNHRGPLVEELSKYNRRFKWPDQRVKLYFPKEVTKKWINFVNKYEYPRPIVKQMLVKHLKGAERIYAPELPAICDFLKLYLLVINQKVDYQMKFMDIAFTQNTYGYLVEKDGGASIDKFLKWWYNDYETIIEEMMASKATEKK